MNISKSSKRWRNRLSCGLVGVLALGLCTLTEAQPSEPPKNSLVALKLTSWPESASKVDSRVLKAHPLYELVERVGKKEFGIEPLTFLDEAFEGTFVAAVVAPESKSAPKLRDFIEDVEARSSWATTVRELTSLRDDLVGHYGALGENYPENLDHYLEEIRYYTPGLPYGVDFQYKVSSDGKGFELRAVFPKGSRLSKLGKPPVLTSDGEMFNLKPTADAVPLNLVMGARIKDKAQVVELLDRYCGPSKNGFWSTDIDDKLELLVTVRGEWLVAGDQMSNLGELINSLNGTTPGWSKNSSFQVLQRNLDTKAPFFLFIDTPRILSVLDSPRRRRDAMLPKLVGPFGYAVTPYTESQFRQDLFLGVTPPKGSELAKYFKSSGTASVSGIDTSNIPWDASNVLAVDFRNTKELVDAVVALFPDAAESYETGQDVLAGMLGFDAEAGFNTLFSGPVVVSFERVDLFINMVESWFVMAEKLEEVESAPPEDSFDNEDFDLRVPAAEGESSPAESETEEILSPAPEAGEQDPQTDDESSEHHPKLDLYSSESDEPKPGPFSVMPATLAFKVPSEANREAILATLKPYLGEVSTSSTPLGVELVTSADSTVSYAQDGDWFYLSGGRTGRLARYMMETSHGHRDSLASIDSWNRFALGAKGRLLGFGHQKVDAAYALAKGFLLILGVEFRPMAEELGKLRDYHSVFTVVPEGFVISGEIVQGDAR